MGGMFCALHTQGKNLADMVLKNPAAVKFAMGENTGADTKKAAGQIAAALSASPALRRLPVKVHAHKKEDLLAANALAKGKNLFLTLEHATDAHLVSDKLSHVSGICAGPLLTDISKDELLNLTPAAAGILHGAGFCVSICSDHPETPVNYLQLYACLAAKEGLTPFAALAAITINAAKNCGLEGLVGSLAPGKRADCCLFSGHPIRFGSRLLRVVINGQFCI